MPAIIKNSIQLFLCTLVSSIQYTGCIKKRRPLEIKHIVKI